MIPLYGGTSLLCLWAVGLLTVVGYLVVPIIMCVEWWQKRKGRCN